MKILSVTAAIIEQDDKILIAQRAKGSHKGYWEFPGGKYEKDETGENAIIREIKEEFEVDIKVKEMLGTVYHQYPDFFLVMDCFICEIINGDIVLHDHLVYKFVDPKEIKDELLGADIKVLEMYRQSK